MLEKLLQNLKIVFVELFRYFKPSDVVEITEIFSYLYLISNNICIQLEK